MRVTVNPVRRDYADLSWGQIHYRSAGDSNAPVLVLLHQSPSHSVMYEKVMLRLADRFHLLAPDTPGFGGSDRLPAGIAADIPAFASAITEWLAHVGVARCGMFGHHTGAAIAAEIASREPGLVAALALSGPTLLSEEQKLALPAMATHLPPVADGSHLTDMWQRIRAKDEDASTELIHREVLSALACGEAYSASYLAVTQHDFAGCLAKIDCPALVFAGDRDPLFDAVPPTVATLSKGETVSLGGGERTYVCDRQSEQIASLLSEFFSRGES